MILQNKKVHQLICHTWYVDTAIEGSELYCYNTEDDRSPVASQASCRMEWTLLELQAETGIEKRTIHEILRKMDTICNMPFTFFFNSTLFIHTRAPNTTHFHLNIPISYYMIYQSCKKRRVIK